MGFFWIKVGPATWYSVFLSGATFLSCSFCCWKMHLDCKDFSSCNKKKQRMIYVFLGILCKYREEENHSAHLSEDQAPILWLFTSLEVFPDLQWHQCFNFTADCDPIPLSYWAKKGRSAIPKCSEEDESWLGANWKQVRAGVTSFSYFPTLWQMFLMAPWLVWFAVLAGALILFSPLIRQQGGWKFPPARLHFVRKLNCMIDADFL